jgi:hypothetical protein
MLGLIHRYPCGCVGPDRGILARSHGLEGVPPNEERLAFYPVFERGD